MIMEGDAMLSSEIKCINKMGLSFFFVEAFQCKDRCLNKKKTATKDQIKELVNPMGMLRIYICFSLLLFMQETRYLSHFSR